MLYTYSIPVKAYLYKYMNFYVSVDPYFAVSEKHRYGKYILSLLNKKSIYNDSLSKFVINKPELLKIGISDFYATQYGYILSKKNIYDFNVFLQDEFEERLIEFVLQNYTGAKGEIKKALLAFREKYKIYEDDLSTKYIEKIFERNRDRFNYLRKAS